MRRFEMCSSVGELAIFDDDETSCEEVQGQVIGCEVCNGSFPFLCRGMGGLEDEDGFREDKQARGLEERMGGE